MLHDKENASKKDNKRKSIILNDDFCEKKRKSIFTELNEKNEIQIKDNLISIKIDDQFYSQFQNNLKNDEFNGESDFLKTNQSMIINENDIFYVEKEHQFTPILTSIDTQISGLTIPFNDSLIFKRDITPKEQIIPFSEFNRLPRPELSGNQNFKSNDLEKAKKQALAYTDVASSMNDSFELIKKRLYRSRTYTPLFINNTPETPSDLHDFDLDNMGTIRNIGRDSLCEFDDVKFSLPKSASMRDAHVSPIFLEIDDTVNFSTTTVMNLGTTPPGDDEDHSIELMNAELVAKIIDNDFTSNSFAYHIIDCRYPYEYEGGHINGAVNLYTPYQMLNYIFLSKYNVQELQKPLDNAEDALSQVIQEVINLDEPNSHWKNNAYIFHCEFSSLRGPELARCLRNMDRLANWSNYPKLYFPKLYIMSKGYKEFYTKFKELCKPSHYVTMDIVDPRREKGECMTGEDDDELNNSCSIISDDTFQERLMSYNYCKKEVQEQTRLFNKLISMENCPS